MDKVRAKHHIKFLAEEDKIALTTHARVRLPGCLSLKKMCW
jgi:hypothetical protein